MTQHTENQQNVTCSQRKALMPTETYPDVEIIRHKFKSLYYNNILYDKGKTHLKLMEREEKLSSPKFIS